MLERASHGKPALSGLLADCVPWPKAARTAPLNPVRASLEDWTHGPGLPAIRLAWTLYPRTAQDAADWLALAARAGHMLWLADLRAAERNLDLPAVLLAGMLTGRRGRRFLASGGLEGCAARAGLRVVWRQPFWAGAGLVLGLTRPTSGNRQI